MNDYAGTPLAVLIVRGAGETPRITTPEHSREGCLLPAFASDALQISLAPRGNITRH